MCDDDEITHAAGAVIVKAALTSIETSFGFSKEELDEWVLNHWDAFTDLVAARALSNAYKFYEDKDNADHTLHDAKVPPLRQGKSSP